MFRRPRTIRSWTHTVVRFWVGVSILMLRTLGVVSPRPLLWALLWPAAMLRSAWELSWGRPTLGAFRKLSGSLLFPDQRRVSLCRLLLGRTRLNLTKLLFVWPEKLTSARGVPCRVEGADRLEGIGARRPALLLTLHFGPMSILLNWLRARGYPAAMVALRGWGKVPWYRRHLARIRDTITGLQVMPSLIEVGQILEMRDHLDAGGILLAAVDGHYGRHSASPIVEDLRLKISTGTLQLAAFTGATVIPCLSRSGPMFSLTVHLGEPLTAEAVADKGEHPAACDHLLREFLRMMAAAPEECSYELLASLERVDPKIPDGVPEKAAGTEASAGID